MWPQNNPNFNSYHQIRSEEITKIKVCDPHKISEEIFKNHLPCCRKVLVKLWCLENKKAPQPIFRFNGGEKVHYAPTFSDIMIVRLVQQWALWISPITSAAVNHVDKHLHLRIEEHIYLMGKIAFADMIDIYKLAAPEFMSVCGKKKESKKPAQKTWLHCLTEY